MGWTNFIVISHFKLIVEINRSLNELYEYKRKALAELASIEEFQEDIGEVILKDITINDLTELNKGYQNYATLCNTTSDEMFLFWLESREIKYEIKNEYHVDINSYKEKDYIILRL